MLEVYRQTEYRIGKLTLRIGETTSAPQGVFITACNPMSVAVSAHENEKAMAKLLRVLTRTGAKIHGGIGVNGAWSEASYFAEGLSLEQGERIALMFEQKAFVWIGAERIPTLIFPAEVTPMMTQEQAVAYVLARFADMDATPEELAAEKLKLEGDQKYLADWLKVTSQPNG